MINLASGVSLMQVICLIFISDTLIFVSLQDVKTYFKKWRMFYVFEFKMMFWRKVFVVITIKGTAM